MQEKVLCSGEKKFVQALLDQHIRLDGRSALQNRRFTTEMDPLPLSPSSCRVTWGHGYGDTTEVIVSVSTEIAKTELSEPMISVKALQGSFGVGDSIDMCRVIQSTLTNFMQNSKCIEPSQFVIVNSPSSWKVFIDILIVRAAGAVYEAAMIGIKKALGALEFPQVIVTPGDTLAELHFDVDETKESVCLIKSDDVPFVMSFAAADNTLLLDPTPAEIAVVQSLVVVGVGNDGCVLGMNHFGERGMKSWMLQEIAGQTKTVIAQIRA